MLPCSLFTDPPFVLALLWLARALGRQIGRGRYDQDNTLLELAIGLGSLQFVFFGLGTLGLAKPLPILVTLLLLALGARREFSPLPRLRFIPREPLEWALALALLCFFPFAVAPVTDHDGQFYHLTALRRWLITGRLDYLPTLTMTQWPMGVDMLFGLPLALWSDTAAKLLHFALGGLALGTLAALGIALGSRGAGLLAGAALLLLGRGEFCAAYVDLGVAFQTAAALLAFVLSVQRNDRRLWLLAALLSGFAASFKLTGVFLGLGLLLASGPRSPRDRVIFLVLTFAPIAPYLLRAWCLTGNPLYPTLASIFPTRDWSAELSRIFLTFNQLYNWGSGQSWNAATRQAIRGGLILTVLGGGFFWRRAEALQQRLAWILAGLLALSLWLVGPYPRYLLPLLPVVILLVALRLHTLRAPLWLASVAVLGGGVLQIRQLPAALPAILGGKAARATYLTQQLSLYPVLIWINQTTPKNARILLVADTAYYCERSCWLPHPYLQGAIRLTRYDDFTADVMRARLTHVVVGRREQPPPSLFPTENQVRFSQRLARERGVLIFQNDELEVWKLRNW
ncbi:hypothetical protein [Armatimonas sp.]|uniref:hypothetical protein n=1 Tax=Armatimonas sp. TaxID=1872638 RepID=UPI0037527CF4